MDDKTSQWQPQLEGSGSEAVKTPTRAEGYTSDASPYHLTLFYSRVHARVLLSSFIAASYRDWGCEILTLTARNTDDPN